MEVAEILCYKTVLKADKGEGVKKSENFADVINGCPLAAAKSNAHDGERTEGHATVIL